MRGIFQCCAKVSQTESFGWFANLSAFSCTRSNAFIWPSTHGSQHEAPHYRIGRAGDVWTKLSVLLLPVLKPRIMQRSAIQAFCAALLAWSTQLISSRKIIPEYFQLLASVFFGPSQNNLEDPSLELSWTLQLYFYLDLFSPHFLPPNSSICPDLPATCLCRCHSWFSYLYIVESSTKSLRVDSKNHLRTRGTELDPIRSFAVTVNWFWIPHRISLLC